MMDKIIRFITNTGEKSKIMAIVSLIIWIVLLVIVVGVAETIAFQYYQDTASIAIDPLSIGFITSWIFALFVLLPLISFSYHHAKHTDIAFLIKIVKHLWVCNLFFVGIACFVILAELSNRWGFI